MTQKQTAFNKAVEGGDGIDHDDVDSRVGVPRVVFTKESTLDLSKLQIPLLRMAQGMTQEVSDKKAMIGQYVLSNYPAYDSVVIVPLGGSSIRVYKPDPKKPALCNAPTGDFGFGNPGGVCANCPLSEWGERDPATGKSTQPPCKEGVIIRAYSVTHRALVDFQVLAAEASKGGFIQQQAMTFGWSNFAVKLSASQKSNNRGSWYVPEVEMLEDVPENEKEIVSKWFAIFQESQAESKSEALNQLTSGSS